MRARKITLLVAVAAALGATTLVYPIPSFAADAAAIQPRDGWYNKALVDFDFVKQNVGIPLKKGVVIIDSRPAALGSIPVPTAAHYTDHTLFITASGIDRSQHVLQCIGCVRIVHDPDDARTRIPARAADDLEPSTWWFQVAQGCKYVQRHFAQQRGCAVHGQ